MQLEHIEAAAAQRMLDPKFTGKDLISQILGYAAQAYSTLKTGHDMSVMEEMAWVGETIRLHEEKNAEQWKEICEVAQVYLDRFWRPNYNAGRMTREIDIQSAKKKLFSLKNLGEGRWEAETEGEVIVYLLGTVANPIDFGESENKLRCRAVADWFMGGNKPLFKPEILDSSIPADREKIKNRFKKRK